MAHALLSPSSAVIWLNCVGAPSLYRDIPNAPTRFTEEGTRAHALAEQAAINEFSSGEGRADLEGEDEMVEAAVAWANVLRNVARPDRLVIEDDPPILLWGAERRVPIGHITGNPGDAGTADFFAVGASRGLFVADFKYGRGVPVAAKENPQLMTYASGLLEDPEIRKFCTWVRLVIFQPRISSEPQVWETTVAHIDEFAARARAQAKRAMELVNGAVLRQGDLCPGAAQCRFCRAKGVCPALKEKVREETRADFEVIDPAPAEQAAPRELIVPESGEALARVLPWLETIEKWCSGVREAAARRLESGKAVPGFKLVAGRKGARKWIDGAEQRIKAMRLRNEVVYQRKLVSPTAMEKAAKAGKLGPRQWKALQPFIEQSDSAPAVVPESDRRPAISAAAPAIEDKRNKSEAKAEQAAASITTSYKVDDLF